MEELGFNDLQLAMADLIEPVVPKGLTMVYLSPDRPLGVAVDEDFGRVDLRITLGDGSASGRCRPVDRETRRRWVPSTSVVVASDRFVWVVSVGVDSTSGAGAVRVERFDRASGTPQRDTSRQMVPSGAAGCAGPVDVLDDADAPLQAIPLRCTVDGHMGTIDVWKGAVSGFRD